MYSYWFMNWVRHGRSTTWFQTSRYCCAKVEFNSINIVGHGSSTTSERGLWKPINLLLANMAMSDLLYPTFLFPVLLADLHVGSWLIGGTLGQALCKLHVFLADCSVLVSIQSLVLIAVDRFGALVVPLRSPVVTRRVLRTLSCRNVVKRKL